MSKYKLELREDFAVKLMNGMFKDISNQNFIIKWISRIIDSSRNKAVRLDTFLSRQLDNPSESLKNFAETFIGTNHNATILNILKWVKQHIKYTSDSVNFGKIEYWASTEETLSIRKGDCDDMNSMIYIIGRLAGIPSYLMYNVIGDTSLGLHYYLLYLRHDNGKLYSIDSTYYPDLRPFGFRPVFKLSDNRYKDVKYIFNENHIFKGI